ncbi:CDP-diacylglycerol--serine O-phosphatidyltransferase [uncultured Cetobacterium sp.]|uniref:CDP-diacylglycerol--serine O-phosphatidyltransferase n=1 Tax=uncultured Cetobacterium sp. TaxID=527638 RepID=UPI00261E71E8|nr:CDP-diacylglycerol--serine O-phosphatidyltransferase [uncultured Cetobacterium sp.]
MVERKYIAPNAITAANMFLGYLSITASIAGDFSKAIWFIILGMVCDGLDGKTARKLDAFSEFGKEFDSFCDAITFGLAPAILVYSVLNKSANISSFVIPISFIYALCGVMRLVKFNIVTTASSEKDDFSGMPIPSGASVVCSYLLFVEVVRNNLGVNLFSVEMFVGLTLVAAILMVSTIPFKTPDKVFSFVPKKLMVPFILIILATLKYSMFIVTCYYILVNLLKFFTERSKDEIE